MKTRTFKALRWLPLEAVMPGATLFLLLVWLSQVFLRDGFGELRQHAVVPAGGKAAVTASAQRGWWSCTCRTCRCPLKIVGALGRSCIRPAAAAIV